MRRRLALLAIGLGAGAVLIAPAAAALVSWGWGRDVILISPHSLMAVALNRAIWSSGEPVSPIYGIPASEPIRIVFADPARVIVPPEDTSLTLYSVDKQKGENPLQVRTLWFMAKVTAAVGALMILAGGGLLCWSRLRPSA